MTPRFYLHGWYHFVQNLIPKFQYILMREYRQVESKDESVNALPISHIRDIPYAKAPHHKSISPCKTTLANSRLLPIAKHVPAKAGSRWVLRAI